MAKLPTATTAGEILNRVAAEVGIKPIPSPYSSTDKTFIQLQYLLRTAGEELAIMHPWEQLQTVEEFTTAPGDSGDYPLPPDFGLLLNQTGWVQQQTVPLFGPLSPQEWSYLVARTPAVSVYAMFRLQDGLLRLYPQPPPPGLDIRYEYMSQWWVLDGDDPTIRKQEPSRDNDIVQFHRTLITRYVKVKYCEAHGLDSTKAQDDLNQVFGVVTAQNAGARVLNAGLASHPGIPYLDGFCSAPSTGYGH